MRYPKDLKKIGRAFWKKVLTEYELDESHDLERLHMACRCLDDIATAETEIKRDGPYVKDRYGQVKSHPATKDIKDNRIIFCRIIRELALDIEPPESRPPRRY